MDTLKVTIIGGGVVGLLTALKLSESIAPEQIVLLEKEAFFGDHTSGRHSNVLHSGIYYPYGSLKHKLCMEGLSLWDELCEKFHLEINRCGKYLFANSEQEIGPLNNYIELAKKKGIPFRPIKEEEKNHLSQYTHLNNGVFVKSTAMINASDALKKFEDELFKKGAILQKNTLVKSIAKKENLFSIECEDYSFQTETLINCAGLGAIDLRKQLGLCEFENYFVKGNYIKTYQSFFKDSLLYPIPPANLLGLGVHTTFDIDGTLRFGPNTEIVNEINYKMKSNLIEGFIPAIEKQFIGIDTSKLELDYCGIRPKIKKNGKLYTDFVISSPITNYIECLGIESPGLTSSPAIARLISSLLGYENTTNNP